MNQRQTCGLPWKEAIIKLLTVSNAFGVVQSLLVSSLVQNSLWKPLILNSFFRCPISRSILSELSSRLQVVTVALVVHWIVFPQAGRKRGTRSTSELD